MTNDSDFTDSDLTALRTMLTAQMARPPSWLGPLLARLETAEAERDAARARVERLLLTNRAVIRRAEGAEADVARWKDAYNTAVVSGRRGQP